MRDGGCTVLWSRGMRAVRCRPHLAALHAAWQATIGDLAELFSVSRATVYRELARSRALVAT